MHTFIHDYLNEYTRKISFSIVTSFHLSQFPYNLFLRSLQPGQRTIKQDKTSSVSKFLHHITNIFQNTNIDNRYIVSYKMLYLPHLLFACVGLAAAAPRKYGRESYHEECRTEYKTVYETEYEEIESHTCVTKWVPDCKTVYERVCKPIYREEVS